MFKKFILLNPYNQLKRDQCNQNIILVLLCKDYQDRYFIAGIANGLTSREVWGV